jgi:acetyl esterase/lipase
MNRALPPTGLFLTTLAGLFLLAPAGAIARPPDPKAKQKQPPQAAKLPAGTREFRDLVYGPHNKDDRNSLDLFVPKSDRPLPLVLWVHGGAWQGGSKNPGNPAMRLLERGYAVAATNYRLSQHATFPAQIEDCKAAVRYLRANAEKYNLDPGAFGVWGSSAGGHLVALLGTAGDVKELEGDGENRCTPSRVQAVADFYGPTDLTKMAAQSGPNSKIDHDAPNAPEAKLLGGPVQQNKEKAARANPITYVSKDDPPFLIVHGDADPVVPLGQSELLHAALKKAGVESELVVIKGGGHGGAGFGTPENQDKIAAFFDRHLKKR